MIVHTQMVTPPTLINGGEGDSKNPAFGFSASRQAMEDAEMVDGEQKLIERKQALYRCLDERFVIRGERYKGQQYSQIYFTRLHHMRNLLRPLVPDWKPHLPVQTVLGLEEGKECIVIGTIYKHMKLKPSILDEYSKERSAVPLVKPHNFTHPDDHLILEDESGRVKLAGNRLIPSTFVTGVVLAVHGNETSDGHFLVLDVEAGYLHRRRSHLS